jgi:hypothetical protein
VEAVLAAAHDAQKEVDLRRDGDAGGTRRVSRYAGVARCSAAGGARHARAPWTARRASGQRCPAATARPGPSRRRRAAVRGPHAAPRRGTSAGRTARARPRPRRAASLAAASPWQSIKPGGRARVCFAGGADLVARYALFGRHRRRVWLTRGSAMPCLRAWRRRTRPPAPGCPGRRRCAAPHAPRVAPAKRARVSVSHARGPVCIRYIAHQE